MTCPPRANHPFDTSPSSPYEREVAHLTPVLRLVSLAPQIHKDSQTSTFATSLAFERRGGPLPRSMGMPNSSANTMYRVSGSVQHITYCDQNAPLPGM